jgi:hypothetical protein
LLLLPTSHLLLLLLQCPMGLLCQALPQELHLLRLNLALQQCSGCQQLHFQLPLQCLLLLVC